LVFAALATLHSHDRFLNGERPTADETDTHHWQRAVPKQTIAREIGGAHARGRIRVTTGQRRTGPAAILHDLQVTFNEMVGRATAIGAA
jgi:hypothetical protein